MVNTILPILDPSISDWPAIVPISSLEKCHEFRRGKDYSAIVFDCEQSRQIVRLFMTEFLGDNPINSYIHIMTDIGESLLSRGKRLAAARISLSMNSRLAVWEMIQLAGPRPTNWRILRYEDMKSKWFLRWHEALAGIFVLGHEIGHFLNDRRSPLFAELRGYAALGVERMGEFTAGYDQQVHYTFSEPTFLAEAFVEPPEPDVRTDSKAREGMETEVACDLLGLLMAFRAWSMAEQVAAQESVEFPWLIFLMYFQFWETQHLVRLLAEQYAGDSFPQQYKLGYPKFGQRFWADLFALSTARYSPGPEYLRLTKEISDQIKALDLSQRAIQQQSIGPLGMVNTAKNAIWPEDRFQSTREEAPASVVEDIFPKIPEEFLDWDELMVNRRARSRDDIEGSSLMRGFAWAVRDTFSVFLGTPDVSRGDVLLPLDSDERSLRDDLIDIQACRAKIESAPFYPFHTISEKGLKEYEQNSSQNTSAD